jgi:hypothetical protein
MLRTVEDLCQWNVVGAVIWEEVVRNLQRCRRSNASKAHYPILQTFCYEVTEVTTGASSRTIVCLR